MVRHPAEKSVFKTQALFLGVIRALNTDHTLYPLTHRRVCRVSRTHARTHAGHATRTKQRRRVVESVFSVQNASTGTRSGRNRAYIPTPNRYINHLRRFRDECLERRDRAWVEVPDMCAAYDWFCRRDSIINRKIPTFDLPHELAKVGVASRSHTRQHVTRNGNTHPRTSVAYLGWRLTRNTKYAIRHERRTVSGYAIEVDDDDESDA